ncbi:MFS transporter [Streptomyces sp. SP18ES09]|uniref:MFS transporter n=1 Tax=Streptomyces sp. SP18ES09 TaxID=3002532 RepID=UPI002E798056|nr:MFS transporter [Streptomyces sp. SP18ES09]MEE1816805.1 MFS transporter [Streptomyces sp. SP18ES09]
MAHAAEGAAEDVAAVLAEPTVPVEAGWTASLSLATLAVFMAFMTPIQILLPLQLEHIDPHDKNTALSLVTGLGALVAVLANPLAGAWSDRTTSRFGRRRPWIVGGALVGAVGLVATASQHTVTGVAVGWCLAQLGLNAMLAGVTTPIADRVPLGQRAVVSGWTGLMQSVGLVLGALITTLLVTGVGAGYVTLAVLTVALALPFALRQTEPVLPRELRPAFDGRAFARSFWVSPRRHPDFGWAWLTRFLINLGNALGTLYLFYFLADAVRYDDPGTGVLILTVVYTLCAALTAVPVGVLSDRAGRRKGFVVVCSLVMAAAALLLALVHTWPSALAAAAVLGGGYGIYLAVDQALVTQVLPTAADRAKDLGVINIANSGPQVLAPALAAPVIAHLGGYTGLYAVAALVILAGGLLVHRIRGVA